MPIRAHSNLDIQITQPYGSNANVEWYKANNIEVPFHNGVDLILTGTERQTYGSALITPTDGWKIVKVTFDSPMSTKGNGITIECQEFEEDGITKKLQVVYWHCSEIVSKFDALKQFDEIAYIGNSGAVNPAPTPECPYCGSHLHLMLFEFHKLNGRWMLQNENNGVKGAIDPMTRFDIAWIIRGEDTSVTKDTPPLKWAMDRLGLTDVIQKVLYVWKTLFK